MCLCLKSVAESFLRAQLCLAGEEKAAPHKQLKSAVEGSVRMFLQLLDHLVNAEQLLNSPQAATLLLMPVPGSKAAPKQASADELVKGIQARSLA